MSALLLLFARLFIIYLVIKMVWSLLFKKQSIFGSGKNERKETIRRYNADKEKIEDAEFEEIKQDDNT